MIKVKHFSDVQLGQLVGNQLGMKLWMNGMMNEIRRYPNEIPCEADEVPSTIIPFASGPEKVEWGFAAGMSCLSQDETGSIIVRNAEHFPSCAVLALLSLLYDAGVSAGKNISLRLRYNDNPEMRPFLSLLGEAQQKLPHVTIKRDGSLPKEDKNTVSAKRKVFPVGSSACAVLQLNQTDVGRFIAVVRGISGSLHVRDSLTITDGSCNVLQEHCPVISISSMNNQSVDDSSALSGDTFIVYFAMWFPPNTPAFDGMMLIREDPAPVFVSRPMPAAVSIQPERKNSLFDRIKSAFK